MAAPTLTAPGLKGVETEDQELARLRAERLEYERKEAAVRRAKESPGVEAVAAGDGINWSMVEKFLGKKPHALKPWVRLPSEHASRGIALLETRYGMPDSTGHRPEIPALDVEFEEEAMDIFRPFLKKGEIMSTCDISRLLGVTVTAENVADELLGLDSDTPVKNGDFTIFQVLTAWDRLPPATIGDIKSEAEWQAEFGLLVQAKRDEIKRGEAHKSGVEKARQSYQLTGRVIRARLRESGLGVAQPV
jgi:hypothetical protein